MLPSSVNFTALPIRLSRICRIRPGSPTTTAGTAESTVKLSTSPFCDAGSENSASIELRLSRRLKAERPSFRRPASILVKSRMSSMMSSSASAERSIVSKYARCCSVRTPCFSNAIIPITPFIGVRISWDILARKLDLERAADSAWSRASSRSTIIFRSRCSRSPMRTSISLKASTTEPSSFFTA